MNKYTLSFLEKNKKKQLDLFFYILSYIGLSIMNLFFRPIGSDIAVGDKVVNKNNVLYASELGVLASCGVNEVIVYKMPKIGVISTGNELQEPREALRKGKIRDSNRITLLSLLKEYEFVAKDLGIAVDE